MRGQRRKQKILLDMGGREADDDIQKEHAVDGDVGPAERVGLVEGDEVGDGYGAIQQQNRHCECPCDCERSLRVDDVPSKTLQLYSVETAIDVPRHAVHLRRSRNRHKLVETLRPSGLPRQIPLTFQSLQCSSGARYQPPHLVVGSPLRQLPLTPQPSFCEVFESQQDLPAASRR